MAEAFMGETQEWLDKQEKILEELENLSGVFRTAPKPQWRKLQMRADTLLDELKQNIPAHMRHQYAMRLLGLNMLLFTNGSRAVNEYLYPRQ